MQTAPGDDYADIAGSSSLCATHAQSKLGTTRRFAISRGRVLAGCSRAGRGQHVGEPVADVDALPEPIGQGCLGVDVVRCRRDRVHRWDATNGSPAATDCSPCRGNRSRSPRRPSVANATGAHTGLASIAGPVLILINGAHRVDTAMVAANLRVRRLRRAAAGHAAGAAVQCDRSDCLEVERDPQLGAHLSFSIRGGLPLFLPAFARDLGGGSGAQRARMRHVDSAWIDQLLRCAGVHPAAGGVDRLRPVDHGNHRAVLAIPGGQLLNRSRHRPVK